MFISKSLSIKKCCYKRQEQKQECQLNKQILYLSVTQQSQNHLLYKKIGAAYSRFYFLSFLIFSSIATFLFLITSRILFSFSCLWYTAYIAIHTPSNKKFSFYFAKFFLVFRFFGNSCF